jgi:hypothetical protein
VVAGEPDKEIATARFSQNSTVREAVGRVSARFEAR